MEKEVVRQRETHTGTRRPTETQGWRHGDTQGPRKQGGSQHSGTAGADPLPSLTSCRDAHPSPPVHPPLTSHLLSSSREWGQD